MHRWGSDYPLRSHFEKDVSEGVFYVVENDGKVLGFCAITHDQCPEYEETGLDVTIPAIVPHRMAVDPDFKGRGICRILLGKAHEIAVESGTNRIRVDVRGIIRAR